MAGKRYLSLVASALLLVTAAACGGDDDGGDGSSGGGGGGGDVEAFCDQVEELDDEDAFADDDVDAAVEAFEALSEDAPEDVQDDLDTLRETYEELADLDPEDEDTFGEAFEILLDEDVLEATEDFGTFLEDECGIESPVDDASDLTDDLSDLSDFSDLTSDFSDDFSSDVSDDADVNEATVLRDFLEQEHPDLEALAGGIGSAEGNPGSIDFTLTLNEDADPEGANGLCDAVLDYAEQTDFDEVTVEVEDSDDVTLATGELGVGCEAA